MAESVASAPTEKNTIEVNANKMATLFFATF